MVMRLPYETPPHPLPPPYGVRGGWVLSPLLPILLKYVKKGEGF